MDDSIKSKSKSKENPSSPTNVMKHSEYVRMSDEPWEKFNEMYPNRKFKLTTNDLGNFRQNWPPVSPKNPDLDAIREPLTDYNNGYTYENDDAYIPDFPQRIKKPKRTDDDHGRPIKGGLILRDPFKNQRLPKNFVELARAEKRLDLLHTSELDENHDYTDLKYLMRAFDDNHTFDNLVQRCRTFVYLDWASAVQDDRTTMRDVTLLEYEEPNFVLDLGPNNVMDERIEKEGFIELVSAEDDRFRAEAVVTEVNAMRNVIKGRFSFNHAGNQVATHGKLVHVDLSSSRFMYKGYIRAINHIIELNMIDFIFPNPKFRVPPSKEKHWPLASEKLNECQQQAVETIVTGDCGPYPFVLFGPPGTGKTTTLVECVKRIAMLGKEKRILVCAPSNMAADVLALAIVRANFIHKKYVFRLNSLSYEYLDRQKELDPITCATCDKRSDMSFGIPCIENLQVYRIIITTLTSSIYLNLAGGFRGYFSHILIDECGQATEQETWIPIGGLAVPGHTKVALFGDPKQLGAVDKLSFVRDFGYCKSMMERLLEHPAYASGDPRLTVFLEQNYRAHALIVRPSSKLFYDNKLLPSENDALYEMCGWKELPNPHFPVIFHSIRGSSEHQSDSFSYMNRHEAQVCIDYVLKLEEKGVNMKDIGIISPYNRQGQHVQNMLYSRSMRYRAVAVKSVEGFQGSEREIIIVLTTRSTNLGFLKCDKRLNTSITRAKKLLIVLGDEELLGEHYSWKQFIYFCQYHKGFRKSSMMYDSDFPAVWEPAEHSQNGTMPPLPQSSSPRNDGNFGASFIQGYKNGYSSARNDDFDVSVSKPLRTDQSTYGDMHCDEERNTYGSERAARFHCDDDDEIEECFREQSPPPDRRSLPVLHRYVSAPATAFGVHGFKDIYSDEYIPSNLDPYVLNDDPPTHDSYDEYGGRDTKERRYRPAIDSPRNSNYRPNNVRSPMDNDRWSSECRQSLPIHASQSCSEFNYQYERERDYNQERNWERGRSPTQEYRYYDDRSYDGSSDSWLSPDRERVEEHRQLDVSYYSRDERSSSSYRYSPERRQYDNREYEPNHRRDYYSEDPPRRQATYSDPYKHSQDTYCDPYKYSQDTCSDRHRHSRDMCSDSNKRYDMQRNREPSPIVSRNTFCDHEESAEPRVHSPQYHNDVFGERNYDRGHDHVSQKVQRESMQDSERPVRRSRFNANIV